MKNKKLLDTELLVSNSSAFTEDEIKRVLSNTYDGLVYALGGGVAE